VIYDWLVKNDRLSSRKYLVGESYGGFRGPRVTYYLQSQLGIALNGVVLVSPYLNPTVDDNGDLSPLPWMMTLPSIPRRNLEREKKLTPQAMAEVIAYTQGEYATTLLKGRSDPEATKDMIQHVTELTGLDPAFVRVSGGRIETGAYLREVFREEGKTGIGLRLKCDVVRSFSICTGAAGERSNPGQYYRAHDHGDGRLHHAYSGLEIDARYNALSYDVNRMWDRDDDLRNGSVTQLRQAVAADPKMRS